MSSRDDRAKAVAGERWTAQQLVREMALILSVSAGILALLMLLKSVQTFI